MTDKIVSIKVETTGTDRLKDRIIQICLKKQNIKENTNCETLSWYIHPHGDWAIDKGAEDYHHITKDLILKEGVSFESVADQIIEFCKGCDLLTYGNFDWNFIQREFERIGKEFSLNGHIIYDALAIEVALNSHKFADTYKRYAGEDLGENRNAETDSGAALRILKGQIEKYGADEIAEVAIDTTVQTRLSPEQTVMQDDNGNLILQTGKYRGRNILDVCKEDMQYIKWMVQQGIFTKPTKNAIARAWSRAKTSKTK